MAKKIRIGINGLGRIGRLVLRAAQKRDDIEIVYMNGTCPVDYQAYMLKYDTMHGQFDGTLGYNLEKSTLIINGKEIPTSVSRDPVGLKWGDTISNKGQSTKSTNAPIIISKNLFTQLL